MYSDLQDVREGALSPADVSAGVESGRMIILRGSQRNVVVGSGSLIKVNTSIGCSQPRALHLEYAKVREIAACGYPPDLTMDLSIVRTERPVYKALIEEFTGPVGTLPHYLCYKPRQGIEASLLLEEIERQANEGVAWMTLHLAVNRHLFDLAQRTRLTPMTARGGGLVVEDMFLRDTSEGILSTLTDEIFTILKKYGTALSLGTAFRPANVLDALDSVHTEELRHQRIYIDEARSRGIPVMLEAVGHMTLGSSDAFVQMVRHELGYDLPIMTLGPIATDAAVGEDHIANAIGGSYLAMRGGTNVLNSVTREEHTGGVPILSSIMEGLRSARIAAHAVNISQFPALDRAVDAEIQRRRADSYTCVVDGGLFTQSSQSRFSMGCTRCGNACPLLANSRLAAAAG